MHNGILPPKRTQDDCSFKIIPPIFREKAMRRFFRHIFHISLVALALTAISCSHKKVLYVYNWCYYTPEDVIKDFEEKFDCKVDLSYYESNEEMFSKLMCGATGYDIVVPSQDYASIMIKLGMLDKIDHSKVPNIKYINPDLKKKITYDPELDYGIPYYYGAAGICVNKKKVTDYPHDWSIFERTDLKNRMTMMDDMREVMGAALVELGYDLNSTNDSELEKARELISKKWKPNLAKFDAGSFGKAFASGDFAVCHGYVEVVAGELDEDKIEETLDFFIPKIGGASYMDSLCIMKDAPNKDLAHEFINFIQEPENYAKFLDYFQFPDYVNPEAEKFRTTKPLYDASEMDNCTLKNDLGEDLEKFNEYWEKVRFVD